MGCTEKYQLRIKRGEGGKTEIVPTLLILRAVQTWRRGERGKRGSNFLLNFRVKVVG